MQINIEILALPEKNRECQGHLTDGAQKQTEKQLCSEEVLTSKLALLLFENWLLLRF